MNRKKLIIPLLIVLIVAASFAAFADTGLSGFIAGIAGGLIGIAVGNVASRYL